MENWSTWKRNEILIHATTWANFKNIILSEIVCVCVCVHARSVVFNSLRLHGLWPARLLHPWNFPGKNTGVGCHFLLQRISPTQGFNPCLLCPLHWQEDSLPTELPEKPRYSISLSKFLKQAPVLPGLLILFWGDCWFSGEQYVCRDAEKRIVGKEEKIKTINLCVCAQSCLTLWALWAIPYGIDFYAHGIFQARILEWVAISSSRGSPQPRDQTCVSCRSSALQADSFPWCHLGSPYKSINNPQFMRTGWMHIVLGSLGPLVTSVLDDLVHFPSPVSLSSLTCS